MDNESVHLDFLSESFPRSYTVANLLRNTFSRAKNRNTAPFRVLAITWSMRTYIYFTVALFRDGKLI